MGGCYIREKYNEKKLSKIISEKFFSLQYIKKIIPIIRDRIEKYTDFLKYTTYFFNIQMKINYKKNYLIKPYNILVCIYIYNYLKFLLINLKHFSSINIKMIFNDVCKKFH